MLKVSCHLQRTFLKYLMGLGSMLNAINKGNPTSWGDHLCWSEMVVERFLKSCSTTTPFVNSLPLGSCLKKRGIMCLRCLLLSVLSYL